MDGTSVKSPPSAALGRARRDKYKIYRRNLHRPSEEVPGEPWPGDRNNNNNNDNINVLLYY